MAKKRDYYEVLGVNRDASDDDIKKAYRKQPEKATLPRDTLERLSNLLGIYKSLQILLPDAAAADAWVRQPNSAAPFGGRSALQRMLAGNVSDLHLVRRYLDGVRGGGWS